MLLFEIAHDKNVKKFFVVPQNILLNCQVTIRNLARCFQPKLSVKIICQYFLKKTTAYLSGVKIMGRPIKPLGF